MWFVVGCAVLTSISKKGIAYPIVGYCGAEMCVFVAVGSFFIFIENEI
jgi:hypothetical protein